MKKKLTKLKGEISRSTIIVEGFNTILLIINITSSIKNEVLICYNVEPHKYNAK